MVAGRPYGLSFGVSLALSFMSGAPGLGCSCRSGDAWAFRSWPRIALTGDNIECITRAGKARGCLTCSGPSGFPPGRPVRAGPRRACGDGQAGGCRHGHRAAIGRALAGGRPHGRRDPDGPDPTSSRIPPVHRCSGSQGFRRSEFTKPGWPADGRGKPLQPFRPCGKHAGGLESGGRSRNRGVTATKMRRRKFPPPRPSEKES